MNLKPWEYRNREGAVRVCSWCRVEHQQPHVNGTSDGICPGHVRAQLATVGVRVQRDADGVARVKQEAGGRRQEAAEIFSGAGHTSTDQPGHRAGNSGTAARAAVVFCPQTSGQEVCR